MEECTHIKKIKHIYCSNCGKKGHTYRLCREPIQSLGVIVYRIKEKKPPNLYKWDDIRNVKKPDKIVINEINDNVEFLLIRRRDTLGFVEFLRGRYSLSDYDLIIGIFEEMTGYEKFKIKTKSFKELWCELWMIDNIDTKDKFKREYYVSEKKFNTIKTGYQCNDVYVSMEIILANLKNNWIEPEWGFPKGRRNARESDIDCAKRELEEETGIKNNEVFIYKNVKPFEEIFLGSNNVLYKHIYFIGKYDCDKEIKLNESNIHQKIEISALEWMNYSKLKTKIRSYNNERKNMITKVLNTIKYKGLDK